MGSKDERKFENLHKLVQILLDHTEGLTKAEIARKWGFIDPLPLNTSTA
jgi:hypothetical protein